MLDKIQEKYKIDFNINKEFESKATCSLLNEVYRQQNVVLFNQLKLRSDFVANFKEHVGIAIKHKRYEFFNQEYELMKETYYTIKSLNMNVPAEKFLEIMLANRDYRSKLFLADTLLKKESLDLTIEKQKEVLWFIFKNFYQDINLDLILQFPQFEKSIKEGLINPIKECVSPNAYNINTENTDYVINFFYENNLKLDEVEMLDVIKIYTNNFLKEDKSLTPYFTDKNYFKVIESLNQFNPNYNLADTIKEVFSQVKLDAEKKEEINQYIIKIDKSFFEKNISVNQSKESQRLKI